MNLTRLRVITFIWISAWIILMFWAIFRDGQNVPFADEWFDDFGSGLAVKVVSGKFQPMDLFVTNFEHRTVPANLITILNTYLFRYDLRFEMLVSAALTITNMLLLTSILWKYTLGALAYWMLLILTPIVFSLRQLDNWTWGFMNLWFWVVLFLLLGIVLLQRFQARWWVVISLVGLSLIATLTLISGTLLWGIFALLMWLYGERSWRRWGLYLGLMVLIGIPLFLSSNLNSQPQADPFLSPARLIRTIQFTLAYLGAVWTGANIGSLPTAILCGVFGLSIVLVIIVQVARNKLSPQRVAPALGLICFGLASAVATAFGRDGYFYGNLSAPLWTRYTTHAIIFWVGLIILTVLVVSSVKTLSKALRYMLMGSVAVLGSFHFSLNALIAQQVLIQPANLVTCVYTYLLTDSRECLATLILGGSEKSIIQIQERIEQLRKYRLSLFAEPPFQPIPLTDPAFQQQTVDSRSLQHQLALFTDDRYTFALQGEFSAHSNCPTQPNPVAFQVSVRSNGLSDKVFEGRYAFDVDSAPISFMLDLMQFASKPVTVTYTVLGNIPDCVLTEWLSPRLAAVPSQ